VKAKDVARRLFTTYGETVLASRLVQERDKKYDGAGWCREAVEDVIEDGFVAFERRLRRKIAREIRAELGDNLIVTVEECARIALGKKGKS